MACDRGARTTEVPMSDVRFVQANGLRFGYLEAGNGPLVLLVHGFPDTAYGWNTVRAAVAAAGYHAVAPFTRGYAPTEVPALEAYDADTLLLRARATGRYALGAARRLRIPRHPRAPLVADLGHPARRDGRGEGRVQRRRLARRRARLLPRNPPVAPRRPAPQDHRADGMLRGRGRSLPAAGVRARRLALHRRLRGGWGSGRTLHAPPRSALALRCAAPSPATTIGRRCGVRRTTPT